MRKLTRRAIIVIALFLIAGSVHSQSWQDLLKQAETLAEGGITDSARAVLQNAISSFETRFGYADSTGYMVIYPLGEPVYIYYLGRDATREFYLSALRIAEKIYGSADAQLCDLLMRLASLYWNSNQYTEMTAVAERGLSIAESSLGPSHHVTGEFLNLLAVAEDYSSELDKARLHYERAAAIADESLGSDSPQKARSLYLLSYVYLDLSEWVAVDSLLEQALSIFEKSLGPSHPQTFYALNSLGWSQMYQGRFDQGLVIFRDQLARQSNYWKPDCYENIGVHVDVGFASFRLGRFSEAEEHYKQALTIAQKTGHQESGQAGRAINLLALAFDGQGRFHEAKELYERALAIRIKRFGPNSSEAAYSYLDLGITHWCLGEYAQAETTICRAEKIFVDGWGEDDRDAAVCRLNLGLVYESQGRLAEADSVLRLSVKYGEKSLGPQNPGFAHALNNLSNVCVRRSNYTEAESLQVRAVGILENAQGPEHPEVAKFRRDLGRLYAYSGNPSKSLDSYDMFIDWSQRFLENVFPYSSEEQKLNWLREYPLIDNTILSLALSTASQRSKTIALEMLLKSKAMVVEAVMGERRAAYCVYDEEIESKLRELNELHGLIASLSMAGGAMTDSLHDLYAVKDSLEVQISRHCAEFSDALAARRFEIDDISAAIPAGSVLWEFVRYEPHDLDPSVPGNAKLGPERYLAFTLSVDGEIIMTDLDDAGHLDSLVLTARSAVAKSQGQVYSPAAVDAEKRLADVTSQLYSLVFAPLAEASAGKTDIYIAPDGMLNLLPFEILPMPDGSYVIEKYRISYLSSGRDLLRYKKDEEKTEGEMLFVADPDFDRMAGSEKTPLTTATLSSELYGPTMRGITDCLASSFPRLSHSRVEAQSIASQARSTGGSTVREYYDAEAMEGTLKSLSESPRVIHLATHGFFCEGGEGQATMRDNPLLRSGLALAGANRTISGQRDSSDQTDDGILTALEVSGLNLVGTELAVLSACESGVGDLVNGEGVFGLRRAFQHAGAQTVVMSLWPVPDRETSQLMDGFYRRWLEGKSKRDALRESALSVLADSREKRGCGHPLLWGGFILTGNPN